MKSKIHKLTEAMTEALGPVFRAHPDYQDIQQAMGLLLARVAQATPQRGCELSELSLIVNYAETALPKLLDEEQALQERQAKIMAKGIDGFAELVEPGSAADHPDNPNQTIAKTPKHFEPSQGLAAFNGGLGIKARAEAEEIAGQDHSQETGWAHSPIHDEIARHEEAKAARQDTYTPTD